MLRIKHEVVMDLGLNLWEYQLGGMGREAM